MLRPHNLQGKYCKLYKEEKKKKIIGTSVKTIKNKRLYFKKLEIVISKWFLQFVFQTYVCKEKKMLNLSYKVRCIGNLKFKVTEK